MSDASYQSTTATFAISVAVMLVMVLVGLVTFGISNELKKARNMAGLSGYEDFDPNSLPAPAAGILKRHLAEPDSGCADMLVRATQDGTRYVKEAGGGVYYAAEVESRFSIYTISYGHLVPVERSVLDTRTYRKLKHALYHCDGMAPRTGLYVTGKSAEAPQV